MIRILDGTEKYKEDIRLLDENLYRELCFHEGIVKESRITAVKRTLFGERFLGAGFFIDWPPRGRFLEFKTVPGDRREVEASVKLLNELKRRLPKGDHLGVWCSRSREAYLEFLKMLGFSEVLRMDVMEKRLAPEKEAESGCGPEKEAESGCDIRVLDLEDPYWLRTYIDATALGFGSPDPEAEILYQVRHRQAKVFAAVRQERVAGSVTVWPVDETHGAVENIFVIPEYRRQGIASELIRTAWDELKARGLTSARLNVEKENAPAQALYRKLGYMPVDEVIELSWKREEESVK